jgi:hypothetical protein
MQTIQLTGKTYEAKAQLKNYGATFDGSTKAWTMAASAWTEFQAAYPILSAGIRAVGSAPVAMGVCPKCGSYCLGDC